MKNTIKLTPFLIAMITISFLLIGCGGDGDDDDPDVFDISGIWEGEATSRNTNNTFPIRLTLRQAGATVQGTANDSFDDFQLDGEVSGNTFTARITNSRTTDIADLQATFLGDQMDGTITNRSSGEIFDFVASQP